MIATIEYILVSVYFASDKKYNSGKILKLSYINQYLNGKKIMCNPPKLNRLF